MSRGLGDVYKRQNHKLRISDRLYQRILANDIYDTNNNVLIKKGTLLTKEYIDLIKEKSMSGELNVFKKIKIKNPFVKFNEITSEEKAQLSAVSYEKVRILSNNEDENSETSIVGLGNFDFSNTLTISDVVATISYAYNLQHDIGLFDDIDHLGNKRLKLIHEQLRNRLLTAMLRIEKSVQEKLAIFDGNQTETTDEEGAEKKKTTITVKSCLLYTSPSPRDTR